MSPLLRPLAPGAMPSPMRRIADAVDQAGDGMERITVGANRLGHGLAAHRDHAYDMFEQLRREQQAE